MVVIMDTQTIACQILISHFGEIKTEGKEIKEYYEVRNYSILIFGELIYLPARLSSV
jgi:hypothetical protein